MLAVWFYRHQGQLDSVLNFSTSNIEYEATDILAVQTDEDGIAEYSLTAESLVHYSDENLDKLQRMRLNWRPSSNRNVMVDADEAAMYHEQNKVVMTNNVLLSSRFDPSQAQHTTSIKPPIKLVASELIGDLETKRIYSNQPIDVTQGDNSFQSDSFVADLTTGDYEFAQVAVTFLPPPRKEVPLF